MPPSQGFDDLLGLEVVEASAERVMARLRVDERHLQSLGLIHGGVFATVAETVASFGASLSAMEQQPGTAAIGLENHTTFLRAGHAGAELLIEATPMHAGRRTQAWAVTITDTASGHELARSVVRLLVTPLEAVPPARTR